MKKETTKRESKFLSLDSLVPNPWNPRAMNEGEFKALIQSLKQHGQTKPVQVRPLKNGKHGKYEIVGGYHTWKGLKELSVKEIEVNVVALDDTQARLFSLQDNLHGEDSLLKLGRVVWELEKQGYSLKKIAASIGKPETDLKDWLLLLKADMGEKLKKLEEDLQKENLVEMSFILDPDPKGSADTFVKDVTAFTKKKGVPVESVKQRLNSKRITVSLITFNVTKPQSRVIEGALEKVMEEKGCNKAEALVALCTDTSSTFKGDSITVKPAKRKKVLDKLS